MIFRQVICNYPAVTNFAIAIYEYWNSFMSLGKHQGNLRKTQ